MANYLMGGVVEKLRIVDVVVAIGFLVINLYSLSTVFQIVQTL